MIDRNERQPKIFYRTKLASYSVNDRKGKTECRKEFKRKDPKQISYGKRKKND